MVEVAEELRSDMGSHGAGEGEQFGRVEGMYNRIRALVDDYQSQLTQLNIDANGVSDPQELARLAEARKSVIIKLQDAQVQSGNYRRKVARAHKSTGHYFIELMRLDILGPEVFSKYWREAKNIRDRAILEAG